jgi:hypothetical protein
MSPFTRKRGVEETLEQSTFPSCSASTAVVQSSATSLPPCSVSTAVQSSTTVVLPSVSTGLSPSTVVLPSVSTGLSPSAVVFYIPSATNAVVFLLFLAATPTFFHILQSCFHPFIQNPIIPYFNSGLKFQSSHCSSSSALLCWRWFLLTFMPPTRLQQGFYKCLGAPLRSASHHRYAHLWSPTLGS